MGRRVGSMEDGVGSKLFLGGGVGELTFSFMFFGWGE